MSDIALVGFGKSTVVFVRWMSKSAFASRAEGRGFHAGHRVPQSARHDLAAESGEQAGVGRADVGDLLEVRQPGAFV